MFSTFGTLLLIAALLLGGGGATAVAAQTAEPDGALYPVKVWSEEVRFDLARTDQKTDDVMMHGIEMNYLGPWWAMQAAYPHMKARGWGRIQFISSESALNSICPSDTPR